MEGAKKRVLVLGGEGFIGRNIIEHIGDGFECFSLSNKPSFFPRKEESSHLVVCDPYVETADVSYDILIHLIDSQINGEWDFGNAERMLREHLAVDHAKQVIVFSSAVVYADPSSPYGKRKQQLERVYGEWCYERGIPCAIFRLFNVFGSYQMPFRQGSFVANIVCNFLNNRVTEIFDEHATRDFLFAEDIAWFVRAAVERRLSGQYDVASFCNRTLKDMVTILENELHEPISVSVLGKKETRISPEAKNSWGSDMQLTEIDRAAASTIRFYREQLDRVNNALNVSAGVLP